MRDLIRRNKDTRRLVLRKYYGRDAWDIVDTHRLEQLLQRIFHPRVATVFTTREDARAVRDLLEKRIEERESG